MTTYLKRASELLEQAELQVQEEAMTDKQRKAMFAAQKKLGNTKRFGGGSLSSNKRRDFTWTGQTSIEHSKTLTPDVYKGLQKPGSNLRNSIAHIIRTLRKKFGISSATTIVKGNNSKNITIGKNHRASIT